MSVEVVTDFVQANPNLVMAAIAAIAGAASIFAVSDNFKIHASTRRHLLDTSIPLLMGVILAAGITIYDKHLKKEPQEIQNRIEELDSIQASLNDLSKYIDQQKDQLGSLSTTIERLEKKRKLLEPIVKGNEESLQAFVAAYGQPASAVWLDRFIGFVLGIIGSIIATVITRYIRLRRAEAER
ncbi:hypothetical protein [uncultured Pseudodesulfovibrio sp.]|uniref:hypothetical protein n=1 Tax=uncultured Pseudodesulfovibrio sp. TaxID=2035858 RepID=UPI0029C6AA19|nr:hypothetical protein [uncultured Pseudodesulfovibrio sp.]